MTILGLDSSAVSASACVVRDGKLLSENFVNVGLTHSQTLMPLVAGALDGAGVGISDVDVIAVCAGPGSFTGVRIGVAAVKGMALPRGIHCYGVSSLAAAAYALKDCDCIAVAAMDARCSQVYTASFECKNGEIQRLSDDEALTLSELHTKLEALGKNIVFIGDGGEIAYNYCKDIYATSLACAAHRFQRASSVAFIAQNDIEQHGKPTLSASELKPVYLRMPQAERELKKRQDEIKK